MDFKKLFLLTACASTLLFLSCSDDDGAEPSPLLGKWRAEVKKADPRQPEDTMYIHETFTLYDDDTLMRTEAYDSIVEKDGFVSKGTSLDMDLYMAGIPNPWSEHGTWSVSGDTLTTQVGVAPSKRATFWITDDTLMIIYNGDTIPYIKLP